jgi:hypothetical protein
MKWIAPILLSSIVLTAVPRAAAQKTYLLEDGIAYNGHGCAPGINDIEVGTESLKAAMDASGWSGNRYTTYAWPQDFWENCSSNYGSGGLDHLYADAATVSVFSGHGDVGWLLYPDPHNGECGVDFGANMRLGSMNGGEGGYAMWLTCYTLNIDSLPAEANHSWLRQQFGFRNFIGIGSDEARDFFNATNSSTNRVAWINQMDGSGREPIVVTYGTNSTDCSSVRSMAKLKANVLVNDRPQAGPSCNVTNPSFYYCYNYL